MVESNQKVKKPIEKMWPYTKLNSDERAVYNRFVELLRPRYGNISNFEAKVAEAVYRTYHNHRYKGKIITKSVAEYAKDQGLSKDELSRIQNAAVLYWFVLGSDVGAVNADKLIGNAVKNKRTDEIVMFRKAIRDLIPKGEELAYGITGKRVEKGTVPVLTKNKGKHTNENKVGVVVGEPIEVTTERMRPEDYIPEDMRDKMVPKPNDNIHSLYEKRKRLLKRESEILKQIENEKQSPIELQALMNELDALDKLTTLTWDYQKKIEKSNRKRFAEEQKKMDEKVTVNIGPGKLVQGYEQGRTKGVEDIKQAEKAEARKEKISIHLGPSTSAHIKEIPVVTDEDFKKAMDELDKQISRGTPIEFDDKRKILVIGERNIDGTYKPGKVYILDLEYGNGILFGKGKEDNYRRFSSLMDKADSMRNTYTLNSMMDYNKELVDYNQKIKAKEE
ncbi:hypothetical protein J7J26_01960 [Candidatus Micrarchaeota archaeon]|nr:hypothetical protein [Candidatus Micrarchaeota archaeon]